MRPVPKILMPPYVRPSRVRRIERVLVKIEEEDREKNTKGSKPHPHHHRPNKTHGHK